MIDVSHLTQEQRVAFLKTTDEAIERVWLRRVGTSWDGEEKDPTLSSPARHYMKDSIAIYVAAMVMVMEGMDAEQVEVLLCRDDLSS